MKLLVKAKSAIAENRPKEALELAIKSAAEDAENVEALYLCGRLHEQLNEPEKALEDYTKVILSSKDATGVYLRRAELYHRFGRYAEADKDYTVFLESARGGEVVNVWERRAEARFKLGRIEDSLRDFAEYLKLNPRGEPHLWQRGIALYYAGRFEDGRKQFELHQTVNAHDVENAVWHFLCVARKDGAEKARAALIPIEGDSRVPMMQVFALFAGKGKAEDVWAAVSAGEPGPGELKNRRFYAHLYLGLYYEATGDAKAAKEHIDKAANDFQFGPGHYMWEVARVHSARLKKKD